LNEIIHAITNNKLKIEGDLRRDASNPNVFRRILIAASVCKGLLFVAARYHDARTRKGPANMSGSSVEAKAGVYVFIAIMAEPENPRPPKAGKTEKSKPMQASASQEEKKRPSKSPEAEGASCKS
jgi:hypothetical protein